ncbi:hypothetical protein WJX81_003590 [Elliptochloris bilobata]|uniref:Alpha-mannosidase n=1 Tax=Elliptochloris bilobata TaxID=381761 RepID=A0AAW1S9G1_9CHLO
MQRLALVALSQQLLCVFALCVSSENCLPKYNTSSSRSERALNVHIVAHTHDDAGWLKTVDQYYYGSNQNIQLAGVQYILDTAVAALAANPDRKFIYAEMAFFTRWWAEQTDRTQQLVKRLVADGQLDFVNGGWVQHDEAAAHYVAMIDQTTRGHQFLQETFNYTPTVGWQVDPFGHSATQASLLSGLLGFDSLFFGRADYQDMAKRRERKEFEILWRGAQSFGDAADVFTSNWPTGSYGPPAYFNWDWGSQDTPIQDDVCLDEYNVEDRIDDFVRTCRELANVTRGSDIMLTMGTDFQYSNAFVWFKNLDKLIHHANLDGRVNVFYSTPAAYTAAKHAYNVSWPLKTDDFFPYADCPTCYWTGYFTSRPTSKRFIREGTAFLQAARQLELLAPPAERGGSQTLTINPGQTASLTGGGGAAAGLIRGAHLPGTDALEEAVALLQHHDSITGTEKQHVANDYHRRLARGWAEAGQLLTAALAERVVALTRAGRGLGVTIYNPLAWPRTEGVRVPVSLETVDDWALTDDTGAPVSAQLLPASRATRALQAALAAANALPDPAAAGTHELAFVATLPPLGYATYSLQPCSAKDHSIALRAGNAVTELSTSAVWYNASDAKGPPPSNDWAPPSGAYIFRPNGEFGSGAPMHVRIVEGPLLTEVHQEFLGWATATTRIWRGADDLEVEWTAGPLPFQDGRGRELVLRYESTLDTGREFFTDSNGREMLRRVRDWRPTWDLDVTEPVAGNFYPVTSAIYVEEPGKGALVVVTDRAQGGASLASGAVELMLHRRMLLDDWRGVAEPLNETQCGCSACDCDGLITRGVHRVLLQDTKEGAIARRTLQQRANDPLILTFGRLPDRRDQRLNPLRGAGSTPGARPLGGKGSGARDGGSMRGNPAPDPPIPIDMPGYTFLTDRGGLPRNVALTTLKDEGGGRVLLRLAHLYQFGEDAGELAGDAEVDLNALFADLAFDEAEELALSASRPLSTVKQLRWRAGARPVISVVPLTTLVSGTMAISKVVVTVMLALPVVVLCRSLLADNYKAALNGASVVPNPVNTRETGTATFNFNRRTIRQSDVDYRVDLSRFEGVLSVQLKYGGLGYVDKNAGVSDLLAYLYGPSNTSPTGPITGTLRRDQLTGGLSGKTINNLQDDVNSRMIYILVTTRNNPQGALRGQVVRGG